MKRALEITPTDSNCTSRISLKSHLHADWLTVRYPVIHQLQTQLTTIQLLFMLNMKLIFFRKCKESIKKIASCRLMFMKSI